jgi:hypothetical protein
MRYASLALASCCLAFTAIPASAAVILTDTAPAIPLYQVHNNGSQSGDSVVEGVLDAGPNLGELVLFAGSDNLSTNGSGYSQVNGPFTSLIVSLADASLVFEAIKFNLNAQGINGANGVPAFADITANVFGGVPVLFNNVELSQGNNTFYIYGDNDELFESFEFSFFSTDIDADQDGTTARAIDDIRQVDAALAAAVGVNPLTPVPEPATWALLLVGFAAAGAALRSPRRQRRLSVSYG